MSAVRLRASGKFYGDLPRPARHPAGGRCRRLSGADRTQRRRQDHSAARHRRLLAAGARPDPHRRQGAARRRNTPPCGLHRPRHLGCTTSFRFRESAALRAALHLPIPRTRPGMAGAHRLGARPRWLGAQSFRAACPAPGGGPALVSARPLGASAGRARLRLWDDAPSPSCDPAPRGPGARQDIIMSTHHCRKPSSLPRTSRC